MKKLFTALLLTAAPGFAAGESLAELYAAVAEADPRLEIAAATSEIAAARSKQSLAALLPQIAAQTSLTRTREEPLQVLAFDPVYFDGRRHAFSVQQSLFDASKIKAYQASKALVRQSTHELALSQSEVRLDVVERYLTALSAAEQAVLARQEEETSATQLAQARSLYSRELAQITDVLRIESRGDSLRAQRIRAEAEYRVAVDALTELSGRPVTQLLALSATATLPAIEDAVSYWEELSAQSNLELLARQEAVERARLEVSEQRGRALPVLGLQMAGQRSNIGYENTLRPRTATDVVALNVTVPVFAGGAVGAATREATARRRIADLEYERASRHVRAATRSAFLQIQSLREQVTAADTAVASALKSLEASERGFELGAATVVDVLDARRDAFGAQRDHADTRHEYLRQWAKLAHLSGGLDEAAIGRLSALMLRPVPVP